MLPESVDKSTNNVRLVLHDQFKPAFEFLLSSLTPGEFGGESGVVQTRKALLADYKRFLKSLGAVDSLITENAVFRLRLEPLIAADSTTIGHVTGELITAMKNGKPPILKQAQVVQAVLSRISTTLNEALLDHRKRGELFLISVPADDEKMRQQLSELKILSGRIQEIRDKVASVSDEEIQLSSLVAMFGKDFAGANMKSVVGKVDSLKQKIEQLGSLGSLESLPSHVTSQREGVSKNIDTLLEKVKAAIAVRESLVEKQKTLKANAERQAMIQASKMRSRKTFVLVATVALVFILCIVAVLWRDTGFKNLAPASVTNPMPTPIPLVFNGLAKEFSNDSVGTNLKYRRVSLSGTITGWSSMNSHASIFLTVDEDQKKYRVKCEMKGDGDEIISRLMKGVRTQISGALDRVESHGKKNTVVIKDCTFAQ